MTPDEIAAKLKALEQERQQVLLDMQFRLGIIAGREALLREMLAPEKPSK